MSATPLNIWEQPERTNTLTAFVRHTVGFAIALVLLSFGAGAMFLAGITRIASLTENYGDPAFWVYLTLGIAMTSAGCTVACWTLASCWHYVQNAQETSRKEVSTYQNPME